MTNWNILLKPAVNGQVTATVVELPTVKVTAENRQLALDRIRHLISQDLADAELVPFSIPSKEEENPLLRFAGIFKDDPDFEEIVRDMRAEREAES